MNIRQMCQRGGLALIGVLALAVAFSAYGINTIRFGGEMHRVNQQLNDFNADILPPPEYLVESYLIANLVARSPGGADAYGRKLAVLKGQWRDHAEHWAASDLDPSLRSGIAATVEQDGTAFWQIVETAVEAMTQIQASFGEVANITDLIQNIAFQTNILALNAGVEATRAGEAGKGFMVVANEVRALAQRSSEAVTAIQQLMAESGASIANGAQQVASSGNALREMIEIIDRVSQRVEKLASASSQQAVHLNEVDAAVSELERDTHHNAAMAEQSSAASELLRQEVMRLNERTALFVHTQDDSAEWSGAEPARLRHYG